MKRINGKVGRIIANGVILEKHENDMALVFTWLGYDVEFIPPSYMKGQKMPDAIIGGVAWEFKSPQGSARHTLKHILKRAAKQSPHVIIDLRRMERSDARCIAELRGLARDYRSIKKLKIISKEGNVLDILK